MKISADILSTICGFTAIALGLQVKYLPNLIPTEFSAAAIASFSGVATVCIGKKEIELPDLAKAVFNPANGKRGLNDEEVMAILERELKKFGEKHDQTK
jgi:hypothetical protein